MTIEKPQIGKTFGKLTIISEPYRAAYGGRTRRFVDAVCVCGNKIEVVYSPSLCQYPNGCNKCKSLIFDDRVKAKKMRSSWSAMHRRCEDESGRHYKHYKAKGVVVCERWAKFPIFYADMQATWFFGAQIDRYPNTNGNYEPSNCRWATTYQQQRNKECVVLSEADVDKIRSLYSGGKLTQQKIAETYNVKNGTISRIVNYKRWKL